MSVSCFDLSGLRLTSNVQTGSRISQEENQTRACLCIHQQSTHQQIGGCWLPPPHDPTQASALTPTAGRRQLRQPLCCLTCDIQEVKGIQQIRRVRESLTPEGKQKGEKWAPNECSARIFYLPAPSFPPSLSSVLQQQQCNYISDGNKSPTLGCGGRCVCLSDEAAFTQPPVHLLSFCQKSKSQAEANSCSLKCVRRNSSEIDFR